MPFDNTVGVVSAPDIFAGAKFSNNDVRKGTQFFRVAKRLFDIAVSMALLPLLLFFAVVLYVLNPFQNKGSLFYSQQRMGRFCRPFQAFKFRSMLPSTQINRGANDPIETDRIPPLGSFIRKTRIDELPQVINVLRGEMSLIGPRPDYFEHAKEFLVAIPEYWQRHSVRPGISGLAQVTLGYAEGVEATREKAKTDLSYIQGAGFVMENKIVWLTIVTILFRKGA